MGRSFRQALSRVTTRVVGSRFAKPIARVALAAAGLVLLAFIGRTAIAGAIARSAAAGAASASIAAPSIAAPSIFLAPSVEPSARSAATTAATTPSTNSLPSSRSPASPDDPVVLNEATDADLRRLPGIGAKRADAILSLRARLGRFRAVEDLLKVKGIGRATLKRLRPLVRLDGMPPDGGLPRPASVLSP
jgi:competence protein ComEA